VVPLRSSAILFALTCSLACAGMAAVQDVRPKPPSLPVPASDPPAAVLSRFVDALEAGRWVQAGGLLSARWRSGYTPSRLQADYTGAGPLAREAVARIQAAIRSGASLRVEDGRAWLPVTGGRALLVAEEGGWRVDALE
jgi:hypothetical protein